MASVDTVINNCKNKNKQKEILKKLNIDNGKKNILYAPTFRDYDLDKRTISVPIRELSKLKDYNIIIRLHPLIKDKVDTSLFKFDNIVNGKMVVILQVMIMSDKYVMFEVITKADFEKLEQIKEE